MQTRFQLRDVQNTSNGEYVPNWDADNRQVGTQPITVVVETPQSLAGVLQMLLEKDAARDKRDAARDEVRFRNVCAKLLCVAAGAESFQSSSSKRFSSLGIENPQTQQLATVMGVEPWKLVQQADAIIDRHNYRASLEDLLTEVQTLVELITREHERRYTWECRFLRHYADVQSVFEDRFIVA